jgi:hypothetical protein
LIKARGGARSSTGPACETPTTGGRTLVNQPNRAATPGMMPTIQRDSRREDSPAEPGVTLSPKRL